VSIDEAGGDTLGRGRSASGNATAVARTERSMQILDTMDATRNAGRGNGGDEV
jgi:hypothetical protein